MKNITLSAPADKIEQARIYASKNGTTLNNEFRKWIDSQASDNQSRLIRYRKLLDDLSGVNAGRKFSRDEMNQR